MTRDVDSGSRSIYRLGIVVGMITLSFAVGFWVGSGTASEGGSPAIDVAREYGLALPLDQRAAFDDGEISRSEVEQAIERLEACASAGGLVGIHLELRENGDFSSSWQSGDPNVMELCKRQQFDATYQVWQELGRR